MNSQKKKVNVFIAIMAGGTGTRFWPESTEEMPKQFLDILGTGKSLLQKTWDRFLPIADEDHILVVTNRRYKNLVKQQLPNIPDSNILCEPSKNNTAPCIAYTALRVNAIDPESVIIVTPSDHIVQKEEHFLEIAESAVSHTFENDHLITIGIHPTRPDTGYGYIHLDTQDESQQIYKVQSFKEKPTLDLAQDYLDSGEYTWNAGIFIWHTKSILSAFQTHAPSILNILTTQREVYNTIQEQEYIDREYPKTDSISVDYAILEKAKNIYVIPADIGWSDLGTWKSLHEYLSKDKNNNKISENVREIEVKNSLILSTRNRPVIVKGLENYIVIDSDNGLLIYPINDEQEIKSIRERDVR